MLFKYQIIHWHLSPNPNTISQSNCHMHTSPCWVSSQREEKHSFRKNFLEAEPSTHAKWMKATIWKLSSLLVPHIAYEHKYKPFSYLPFSFHAVSSIHLFILFQTFTFRWYLCGIMKTYWRWKNENGRMENNLQIKYIFHQIVRFIIDYCWLDNR